MSDNKKNENPSPKLPDEALDAISGGAWHGESDLQVRCPSCKDMILIDPVQFFFYGEKRFMCHTCGFTVVLDSGKYEYEKKILEKVDGAMG